jgi:mRNA interferase YafQ
MREIERTTRFRRDYKREIRGRHGARLEASLLAVLDVLVSDEPLAERYRCRAIGRAFEIVTSGRIWS